MDVQTAIITRRSQRQFTGGPLTDAQMETILRAAMQAPSGVNQQPWHFVIFDEPEVLAKIAEVHPHAGFAKSASAAILVCADPSLEIHIQGLWSQDLGAATQNILLSAHGLGLGACWCGVHHAPATQKNMAGLAGLPEGIRPYSLVVIGRPAQITPPESRYNPGRVHRHRW